MKYDVSKLGVEFLNPMQQEMLQMVRKERQLVLLSPTGSGKTLAYMLPVLQLMDSCSLWCLYHPGSWPFRRWMW